MVTPFALSWFGDYRNLRFCAFTPVGALFLFLEEKNMQYERDDLYATKIGILQKYAREIGVKAPTCLTKRALINEIILVQSGKKAPCAPNKRGRPAKNSGKPMIIVKKETKDNQVHEKKTNENTTIQNVEDLVSIEEKLKKEFINRILREMEKKLNKIL